MIHHNIVHASALCVLISGTCELVDEDPAKDLRGVSLALPPLCIAILQCATVQDQLKVREVTDIASLQAPSKREDSFVSALFCTREAVKVGFVLSGMCALVWDLRDHKLAFKVADTSLFEHAVAMDADEKRVAFARASRNVELRDITTGRLLLSVSGDGERGYFHLQFLNDGRQLCGATWSGVDYWELANGRRANARGDLNLARPACSNSRVLVVSEPTATSFHIVDLTKRSSVSCNYPAGHRTLSAIALAPNSKKLVVGHRNRAGTIDCIDLSNHRILFRSRLSPIEDRFDLDDLSKTAFQGISCLSYSPDGRTFASGGADKTVRIWDAGTGQEISNLRGHRGRITSLVYSPDGEALVSGDDNGTVFLWDARLRVRDGKVSRQEITESVGRELWTSLLGTERTPSTLRMVWRMVAGAETAVAFLGATMRPVTADEPARIRKWIGDLDNFQSEIRDNACVELAKLGDLVEEELRGRLDSQVGRDAQQRIDFLLKDMKPLPELQQLRWGLEVLRLINSDESLRLLQTISDKYPGTWLAREAKRTYNSRSAPSKSK